MELGPGNAGSLVWVMSLIERFCCLLKFLHLWLSPETIVEIIWNSSKKENHQIPLLLPVLHRLQHIRKMREIFSVQLLFFSLPANLLSSDVGPLCFASTVLLRRSTSSCSEKPMPRFSARFASFSPVFFFLCVRPDNEVLLTDSVLLFYFCEKQFAHNAECPSLVPIMPHRKFISSQQRRGEKKSENIKTKFM